MPNWLLPSLGEVLAIVIKATAIYLVVIVCTRLAGLRSFSKMSSFDFAMTVAIGSCVATVILTSSLPLVQGIIGVAMIYLLQKIVSALRNVDWVEDVVDNQPLLLVHDGEVLTKNLEQSDVSRDDLRAKLREANALNLEQVEAVVFETTGDVSVLHSEDPEAKIEPWIMEDVRGKDKV